MRGLRVVFDGNGTAFRANVVTELYTKQGVRTSAIVGTLNIIHATFLELERLYHLPIKECIFAWDRGHSPRRTELFPEYKSNRAKSEQTPDEQLWTKEFYEQTDTLHANFHLFGIKSYRKGGWEGDDLILGFTEQLTRSHPQDVSVIVSTDEDFHQLISPTVHVYSPIKRILYNPDNYRELMGIDVKNYLAYKILKGDGSDGIPGIYGIGEKTAKTLVNTYGGLGGLLSHADELRKSKRNARIVTREGLDILDRNDKLINLKDYVDLTPVQDDIAVILQSVPAVSSNQAKRFLMDYQIVSILSKYIEWIIPFEESASNFD